VIEKLCLLSGDLVAVSAGPHLEALLAARGSGSVAASQQNRSTILNIDIGGGTMNLPFIKTALSFLRIVLVSVDDVCN